MTIIGTWITNAGNVSGMSFSRIEQVAFLEMSDIRVACKPEVNWHDTYSGNMDFSAGPRVLQNAISPATYKWSLEALSPYWKNPTLSEGPREFVSCWKVAA